MHNNNTKRKIYLYKEKSARANALIKHINKFNPEVLIEKVENFAFTKVKDFKSYFFILNEKGIESFHNSSHNNINFNDNIELVYPTLEQSRLETSKLYCRQFLDSIGLKYLNPLYMVLTKDTNLDNVIFGNRVIKADGLAAGKGVYVYGDHFKTDVEANEIVIKLLEEHNQILLEEKLEGEEFSCITLSWGGIITHFPLVKDFKRLDDRDQGPNTGGMGTISFAGGSMPFLNDDELAHCLSINKTVITETNYRGFLYGSFIKTNDGHIKVIEYNVRLGDSEAVNILELLDSSLLEHLEDPVKNPLSINMREHTYFRYCVPCDYARSSNNTIIPVIKNTHYLVDANMQPEAFYLANSQWIHYLGIGLHGLFTIGKSRTCGVFSKDRDINEVIKENDRFIGMIYGDLHYRRDIGSKMLEMFNNARLNVNSQLNYLEHLDNYNHIITDVKKRIDQHNLDIMNNNPNIQVLGKIGDFANSVGYGGMRCIDGCRMICSVDGAGTKTKFLESHPQRFEILGSDIVVHNINDMYCNNGRPIALLDYYGCDKLNKVEFSQFISGALKICKEYEIALIGGETAEMRGIFQGGEVEVLGILLGVLEDDKTMVNGNNILAGHIIYGLESHGAHTNGFTKLREIASKMYGMPLEVREFFSQPHRCYVPIVEFLKNILSGLGIDIIGKAHITGGGFKDNIERILPDGKGLKGIELDNWQLTPEWQWLYDNAGMEWNEFIRVFNAGWGFCIIVDKEIPTMVLADIENGWTYGKIRKLGKIV
jgi:phosphoribosylamine--glycine ligase/phosphoribosylformylglycinamidine cyclo-ligase